MPGLSLPAQGSPARARKETGAVAARLISIIGPPAVGKTTLAEHLAAEMPAELIREDYARNPFLAASFGGSVEARLPSQLYFLMSRVQQLWRAAWPAGGLYVSDYGFCQDRIYAATRLAGDDLRAYRRVAGRLAGLVRRPDVLVHLDAPEEVLLERIARRGRAFERAMDKAFLARMRTAYNQVVPEQATGVVRVDCRQADLLDADHRRRLIVEIQQRL